MINILRHYHKWSVNEILNLQREYELLEMSINEIAKKHKRTQESILWKIEEECFFRNILPIEKKYNLRNSSNLVKVEIENFIEQKRLGLTHSKKNKKQLELNEKYI